MTKQIDVQERSKGHMSLTANCHEHAMMMVPGGRNAPMTERSGAHKEYTEATKWSRFSSLSHIMKYVLISNIQHIEVKHKMNLEEELTKFQEKYVALEQQAVPRSLDQHIYKHIVSCFDLPTPTSQWAFETQIGLVGMAQVLDPPEGRPRVWEAIQELEQIADLVPLR
jgi:hypothetical protein